jgi:hypothetical protein
MKLRFFHLMSAGILPMVVAACSEDTDSLLGGPQGSPQSDQDGVLPAHLQCTEKPVGRSYLSFDGKSKLEDSRMNEAAIANRARFKPFQVMAGEYQRVLGVAPKKLESAATSFDAPPDRWYAEPGHSGVSLSAAFDLSFDACAQSVASKAEHAAAPTAESATRYCTTTMRKAWSRSPSPDEVSACVSLATEKLGEEPDARRRWAYVCASILSSSHFLTY